MLDRVRVYQTLYQTSTRMEHYETFYTSTEARSWRLFFFRCEKSRTTAIDQHLLYLSQTKSRYVEQVDQESPGTKLVLAQSTSFLSGWNQLPS